MNQEQLPHPLVSQKQQNILRKLATQSFEPIIQKVQEHISYLLNETQLLRKQNQQLNSTIADHSIINKKLDKFNQQLHRLSIVQNEQNSSNTTFLQSQSQTNYDLNLRVGELHKSLFSAEQKLDKLFKSSEYASDNMEQLREQFSTFCQQNTDRVEKLASQNRALNSSLNHYRENTNNSIDSLQNKISFRAQKYVEIDKKIELYLDERKQMRDMIKHIMGKIDDTIDKNTYDRDWRIIRMQNQQMKVQNRNMIDLALTPQIRQFLPEIISRMDQLRKVNVLEKAFQEQKIKNKSINDAHTTQLINIQVVASQHYTELLAFKQVSADKLSDINKDLSQFVTNQISNVRNTIGIIQQSFLQQIKQTRQNLADRIGKIISQNHEYIYKIVIEQIPRQQKQAYERMKQFLPLLDQTKKEVLQRCDEITQFGKGLQQQLQNFNNKLIKIRSNMTVEFETLQKRSKTIQNTLNRILNQNFANVGKVLSAYCQILMIGLSTQVESFGGLDGNNLVTYNDGMILQGQKRINHHNSLLLQQNIFYRKTIASKLGLSTATLQMLVKLCDELICGEAYSFLKISKHKPSQHFKYIKQQMAQSKNTMNLTSNDVFREKSASRKGIRIKNSSDNRLPSLDLNQAKTMDVSSVPQDSYREHLSQTLNPDFQTITMKIDRGYKGRYSQMK